MRIGQFWRFKNFMQFKLCDCIVRNILLTINFARLKFVRNLIMQSGSDPHKAHRVLKSPKLSNLHNFILA